MNDNRIKDKENIKGKDKYLPFVNREQCSKIPLSEILRIEQSSRIVIIVTEGATLRKYGKLQDIEEYLDERFYHCLKKMIINFQQVSSMKDQTIYFKNGDKIYLGRQNFVRTKQSFAIYIKNPCNFNDFIV